MSGKKLEEELRRGASGRLFPDEPEVEDWFFSRTAPRWWRKRQAQEREHEIRWCRDERKAGHHGQRPVGRRGLRKPRLLVNLRTRNLGARKDATRIEEDVERQATAAAKHLCSSLCR